MHTSQNCFLHFFEIDHFVHVDHITNILSQDCGKHPYGITHLNLKIMVTILHIKIFAHILFFFTIPKGLYYTQHGFLIFSNNNNSPKHDFTFLHVLPWMNIVFLLLSFRCKCICTLCLQNIWSRCEWVNKLWGKCK